MDDKLAKEHGLMTDKKLQEMDLRWKKTEEEGLKNTLKHFDRIHDKLFVTLSLWTLIRRLPLRQTASKN